MHETCVTYDVDDHVDIHDQVVDMGDDDNKHDSYDQSFAHDFGKYVVKQLFEDPGIYAASTPTLLHCTQHCTSLFVFPCLS